MVKENPSLISTASKRLGIEKILLNNSKCCNEILNIAHINLALDV
jgi:hypothetical protein